MLQASYWAVTGRDVVQWSLLWELWFCVGAAVFWLSARRYWRAGAVRATRPPQTFRHRLGAPPGSP